MSTGTILYLFLVIGGLFLMMRMHGGHGHGGHGGAQGGHGGCGGGHGSHEPAPAEEPKPAPATAPEAARPARGHAGH